VNDPEPPRSNSLPRAVVALGWVSLLTDAASDMIYPLIPAFLLTLGGGAVELGWLEGLAELIGAALKLVSGAAADRMEKRKPLVALGYGISALTRPFLAIAAHPFHAVLVRAIDRVGKGLRGPPRDAIVADAVPPERRGHAFGFHRMMDNSGAVIGGLLAFALLHAFHLPLRRVFAIAVIPGLAAVAVILIFVREPPRSAPSGEAKPGKPKPTLARVGPPFPPEAIRYFAALFVFSLAGSGDMFLVLRLTDLGLDTALVPIAWVGLQLGKAVLNVPGGKASDRYGRRRVLVIAWVLYALSYAAFGLVHGVAAGLAVLALYAIHYGLAEGGQRALIAEVVPKEAVGRAYGVQLAIEGAVVLPANVGFGFAYAHLGPAYAFGAAGALALLGAVVLATVRPVTMGPQAAPNPGGQSPP
jgi:MFS family permease